MRHKRRGALAALVGVVAGAVLVPSAWAWTVTMTAEPALKRTHSWEIEKSVSQSSVTLAPGESKTVTYSVTVGPAGAPVDSDYSVSGTMEMSETAGIEVASVVFRIQPENTVASHACLPATFPVELGIEGLDCTYSAPLPDADPRTVWMRATTTDVPPGFRNAFAPINFAGATVNEVDECVDVTDSMTGVLGTVCAADAPKTFTYSKTVGPYSQCGSKTVDNTASFVGKDTGATADASASVAVTVTCAPPKPKCPLPSLVWKFVSIIGPNHVKTLLPVTLGTPGGSKSVVVTSTLQTAVILGKEWVSTNAVSLLATELLAAKLNQAAGRDVSSIAAAMASADAFLATHNAYSYLSTSEKAHAKALTATLEAYNNKCIPDFGQGDNDWCKRHWNKPGHDWNNWSWQRFDWDD